MLKISKQHLDSHKSYNQLAKYSAKLTVSRPFVFMKFQIIGSNFYVNQDIALKFSVFVYQMLATIIVEICTF